MSTSQKSPEPIDPPALDQIQCLIWDWNGTLLDDLNLCLDIINSMLVSRSLPPVSQKRYRKLFGFPVKDYYQRIGFDFNDEPFEALSTEFITAYERGRSECRLMSGAKEALTAAAGLELHQNIISASKSDYLSQAVNSFQIDDYFSTVTGLADHHAAGKEMLLKRFLAVHDFQPQQILMVGDTDHDGAIAASCGIPCLLIPNGHHSRERLLESGATVVESLQTVVTLLGSKASE